MLEKRRTGGHFEVYNSYREMKKCIETEIDGDKGD